ncbi:hypothetical protein [Paraglaciecola aestuariivivens]
MQKLIKFILIFLLLGMFLVLGPLAIVVESQPLVVANSGQQVDHAESVKHLMQQLSAGAKNRTRKQQLVMSQNQLNSLVGFAQRANGKIQGEVKITANQAELFASYALPSNPLGNYLNLHVILLPGPGVNISQVQVGPITIAGDYALATLVKIANWYTQSQIASQFIQQVEYVAMNDKIMRLTVLPLGKFLQDLNELKAGVAGVTDQEKRLRTAFYLKKLSELSISQMPIRQSLAAYIGPLFSLAYERSTYKSAALENEAAIMALAVYAGHHRFANLLGDVQPIPGKILLPKAKPTLNNRVDLNQHFILSAALKILSEQGLSIAIGEFKELMDRGNNGSGYSFVDLAADIAGVEFAISATQLSSARTLQQTLANSQDESLFFPEVKDLPEGLSKTDFQQQFAQVDSPQYLDMIANIKQRVAQLPIHTTN